ncbi:MAG: trigger factor [Verrucomicrobiota bacterium]
MNIAIEELSSCRRRLTIEVPPDQVEKECTQILNDFKKYASIKGFRPGKAPEAMVARKYKSEIESEAKRNLIPKAYQEAVKEKELNVVSQPSIEDLQFERGLSLSFSTVVDLAPEFTLPEYKGIEVDPVDAEATDEDVDQVIQNLLEQRAEYKDIDPRPAQENDFVIIDFTGTIDGKPVKDLAEDAGALSEQSGFWLRLEPQAFLPDFTPQLVGIEVDQTREVNVTIPDDFPQEALRSKEAVYQVTLKGIKEKVLPEFNDEIAQELAKTTADELKTRLKENIGRDKEQKGKNAQIQQIVDHLKERVNCDLPESSVESETKSVIEDIIRENQQRGIPDHMIEENQAKILENAQGSARDRVKVGFILNKIGQKEKIEVSPEEFSMEIQMMAQQYQITPDKIYKTLEENGGLLRLQDDILKRKTIDFLLNESKTKSSPS